MIVVGHSSGAAVAGVIIGRYPGLIDDAILAGCACDLTEFRRSKGRRPWTRSTAPLELVDFVPRGTRVVALTGDRDQVTPAAPTARYIDRLAARGVAARFLLVRGADHATVMCAPELRLVVKSLVENR